MISKKIKDLKIATILPYKENYSFEKASAASLWVSEFYKYSRFKKRTFIFGNTKSKNFLTKNYVNINLQSINSKFRSTTNEYSEKLIKVINDKNFDIIEIHNRPLILSNLINKINSRFIFYFHNDPLSMKGSKNISERLFILKHTDKIIFVSEWVRKRFFLDLDKKLASKTEVIYPSVNKQSAIKKENIITFVGRLNYSKGYDIFSKAIVKILNKFPQWKALSIGDEVRRSIYIDHHNHKELGFLNHKKTLDILNKSEIAVVPSRWEEPFGRSSLEASSRGCATIISDRGGLKETTKHAVILKKIDEINLFKELNNLIRNKKFRKSLQKLSKNNISHIIKDNTKKIDQLRDKYIPKI